MTLPNIALFGYAGAGKDTVAEYLVKTYQYTRVAFADPLKEMALSIDPLIWTDPCSDITLHLSDLVNKDGWESAKRGWPEVRRFLRALGKTMREQDPNYWLDIALDKIYQARRLNMPVVVTDVRHENEYQTLWECPNRFTMVRIDRPTCEREADPESGALIESVTPDWLISNRWDLDNLHSQVNDMVEWNTD